MTRPEYTAAALWAKQLLESGGVLLDLETTGLGEDAEACEIALTDIHGRVLLSSLIRPYQAIPVDATKVHGITNDMVANAPMFRDLWTGILTLTLGQRVIIYNAQFDTRIMAQICKRDGLPCPRAIQVAECAMLQYSAWFGEWNERYASYKWQPLPGGDHSALGDCRSMAKVLQRMANSYQGEVDK